MPAINMMPSLLPQNLYTHLNMPYMFNPYFDAFNMSQFHSSMPGMNNQCAPQMSNVPITWKCVQGNKKKNLWYVNSGCSKHMPGDSSLLTQLVEKAGPGITFGDDNKGYTMGYGLISKQNVIIDEVALLSGLKHNLLSISQLCDKGFKVNFTHEETWDQFKLVNHSWLKLNQELLQ